GRPGRRLRLASGALFAVIATLYLAGASRASPGKDAAAIDFELIAHWKSTGRLEALPQPSHLTKPGYVAILRAAFPSDGASESENRRFLLLNAIAVLLGVGALAYALDRVVGGVSAVLFLSFVLVLLPLRDASDYILTEPFAAGLSMLCMGALLLARSSRRWMIAAGALSRLPVLIPPPHRPPLLLP